MTTTPTPAELVEMIQFRIAVAIPSLCDELKAAASQIERDQKTIAVLVEALTFYSEHVGNCRKNTSEGNDSRALLDKDCGTLADAALRLAGEK